MCSHFLRSYNLQCSEQDIAKFTEEAKSILETYVFPDSKLNWSVHKDNFGNPALHTTFQYDGELMHVTVPVYAMVLGMDTVLMRLTYGNINVPFKADMPVINDLSIQHTFHTWELYCPMKLPPQDVTACHTVWLKYDADDCLVVEVVGRHEPVVDMIECELNMEDYSRMGLSKAMRTANLKMQQLLRGKLIHSVHAKCNDFELRSNKLQNDYDKAVENNEEY